MCIRDSPNRHAFHDVGLATENLLLQAAALGLVAHPMAGFDIEQARADLKIPSGYEPVAMIAVGYPGELSVLPDYLQQRELKPCLLYTSPSPRDRTRSRMPSSA